MATAPVVQTLAQAMAELDPAYAGQTSVVQQQQAGLGAKYDAQRAGLTAEKGQGFNDINNQATGRGLSFSGIPADEQATYLSTKYLPGLQTANFQQNDENLQLSGKIADINADKTKTALGRVDKQTSDLNSWNMQQQQLEAQAKENELNRQASAREAEANRAASAAANAPTGPSNADIVSSLNGWAAKHTGGDGKLSPSDFKAGYQQAASLGMDVDTYLAVMQRYVNGTHSKDYAF